MRPFGQSKARAIHYGMDLIPALHNLQNPENFASPNTYVEQTICQGVQNALNAFNPKREVLVIAGSFFIMHEARKLWTSRSRRPLHLV